jgi:glycosyltransferase involved in cell wall biosynthesis
MNTVAIYCPDSHLAYDRSLLDQKGIGGGATTRTRMAYALAARGHRVRLYINCPRERTEKGVETCHYSTLKQDNSDIFFATTSGGQFDLSALGTIELENRLKILLIHGVARPNGLSSYPFDFVYSPSNFIRSRAVAEWGAAPDKVFVSHRGVMEANFASQGHPFPNRDPFTLLYSGHPSKGLETAIAIFRTLRAADQRFHLHVYGGTGLWGEAGENPQSEAGITFHGIIGQRQLSREIQSCSFSLNLQNRQEPFGMTVIEAMRAGCIVLASPVGAYPEIITHGQDGFLITGNPREERTQRVVIDLILALVHNPEYASYLRVNAVTTPLTWDQVARTWEGHWDWALAGEGRESIPVNPVLGRCSECQCAWLPLADGLHCIRCGNYQRYSSPPDSL